MALTQSSSMECFLRALLGDGRISETEYTTAKALIQKDEQRLRTTQIPGAVTVAYAALPSNHLAALSAVFNTRELLEHIFSHLEVKDLIKTASLTCHGFRNTVNTTPAIRRKLYLEENKKIRRIQTPAIKNIHYTTTNRYVQILVIDASDLLSKYSVVRDMLLTQPAPRTAQLFYDCACRSRDAGHAVCEAGLRFGDVSRLLDQHFKDSQTQQQGSFKPCTCETYKEARIVIKYEQYLTASS